MNLLASLNKPYTETDKQEFINTYYKGTNFIKETEESLEAWEYTEEDNYNVYIPTAPEPTQEQEQLNKEQLIEEYKQQLNDLDLKSIRAIRSNDVEYIAKYEAEAEEIRNKIKELSN